MQKNSNHNNKSGQQNLLTCLCFGGMLLLTSHPAKAQELNATVTINTQQIEASLRDRFSTLKESLEEFINGQQWTPTQFALNERIQCTFALTINTVEDTDLYKASITVQARRPVYNASYQTTLFNWRDDDLLLPYQEGQNLTFNEFNLDSELIAAVAYYSYLVLGLDFDSFSPKGGDPYLRKCESIVSQMQSSNSRGWKAFDSKNNRHGLISALLEPSQEGFRQLWYSYHRQGLDAMAQSMDKGRQQVTTALPHLKEVRSADTQTPLLTLFITAKMDELCNIYSEAPMPEKRSVHDQLTDLFPTYSNELSVIKEEYRE